jgi:GPH family glycoside/pentoside/hexuronide:cation symporter/glucuronide carrier protein
MDQKVTMKEKIAYALTNLGNIPIQTLISTYLLIFYTNVVGLEPAACATLFLIARILDGINDPFIGFFIDHLPTTKWGHFRPSLIVGTILCSLNFLLLWFGPMMVPAGKLAVAYVSYILIGVLFPVMDISLNSLLPVMTEDMGERNVLSSLKGFVYTLGALILGMAAPIILGNTTEAGGYVKLVLMATVIILVFSIIGAVGVKERVLVKQEKGQAQYKLKDLFIILTRRPVLATFMCSLSYYIGTMVLNAVNAYFYTYVLGNLALFSVASMVQMAALVLATLLASTLIKKIGKKKLYVIGLMVFGILPLVRFIQVTNVALVMVATVFIGFGSGLCTPLAYGIQADNTDYIELELGYRAEGAVAALSSFITKCAMGIGGAIPGYLLALAGFDAKASVQAEPVNMAIIMCVTIVPAVFSLIGAAIFGVFYPLTKEKLDEQVRKLRESHGGGK